MVGFLLVACFLGRRRFNSMSKNFTTVPTVELFLDTCWDSCRHWQCILLRLHGIHCHSHLCQFLHDLWVGSGKDWIGFCRFFRFVTLCLHSLDDSIQVIDRLVVFFWWVWRYAVDIVYRRCVSPLSYGGDGSPLFLVTILVMLDKVDWTSVYNLT